LGGRLEVKDARAHARTHRTGALVDAAERRFACAKRPHDHRGEIVLAIGAAWIAARHEEQRRGAVHHEAPDVRDDADARPLLYLELESCKTGRLLAKSRRLLLASASLGKPLSRWTVCAPEHRPQRNHHLHASLSSLRESENP